MVEATDKQQSRIEELKLEMLKFSEVIDQRIAKLKETNDELFGSEPMTSNEKDTERPRRSGNFGGMEDAFQECMLTFNRFADELERTYSELRLS
jgi:hypothetical protein